MPVRIAITMGDPAGVGPEVIAAAIQSGDLLGDASKQADESHMEVGGPLGRLVPMEILILGSSTVMTRAFRLLGSSREVRRLASIDQYESLDPGQRQAEVYCLDCVDRQAEEVRPATVDARGGQAAYQATAAAAGLALAGRIDAMVTAPLHKEALRLAGHPWPGHTEMLAELCGVDSVAMMLYLPPYDPADPSVASLPPRLRLGSLGLGVGHVTLHVGMRQALQLINETRILETSRLVQRVMQGLARGLGQRRPIRLGVAALNPHAGENGLFGREELDVIGPAVEAGRREGLHLSDPLPCDTLMVRAAAGEFDGIVAMYHDQGHIALKLMGMQRAVNIALGLPIVRTSVAHGTAFDRAWQGTADHHSLLHALSVARLLAAAGTAEGVFSGEFSEP